VSVPVFCWHIVQFAVVSSGNSVACQSEMFCYTVWFVSALCQRL